MLSSRAGRRECAGEVRSFVRNLRGLIDPRTLAQFVKGKLPSTSPVL
jgi:hypothetical protein